MSGYEKRMDNSTNKAKLNDFKNLVDFISCQHATFQKLFYYLIFLKREKRRRIKKKRTLLKCQTLNILNYRKLVNLDINKETEMQYPLHQEKQSPILLVVGDIFLKV